MISNECFEKKYSEYKSVIDKLTVSFGKRLSVDERKNAGMIALFNAMKRFKSNKNTSFKTYLTHHIRWECYNIYMTYYTSKEKYVDKYIDLCFTDYSSELFDVIESLSDAEKKLLHERFVMKYTNEELGKIYNITTEGMRLRIINLLNKIKEM